MLSAFATLPVLAQPNKPMPAVEPQVSLLPIVTWQEVEKQMGGLTLVSLRAQKMAASQAVEAIAQQAVPPVSAVMISFENLPPNQRPPIIENTLTAEYEKQPFWVALFDATQKLKTRVENYEVTSNIMYLAPPGIAQSALMKTAGPCVFSLSEARYGRYLNQLVPGARDGRTDAGAALAGETLALNGNIYIDPKMRWHPSSLIVHLQEALDDKNQSLLPKQDVEIYSQIPWLRWALSLKPGAQRSQTLKSLRGSLHGVVAMGGQTWEVEDVMSGKKLVKTFGEGDDAVRVELAPVVDTGAGYRVNMTVSQSEANRGRSKRLSTGKTIYLGGSDDATVRLLDKKGREIESQGLTRQEGGEMVQENLYVYRIYGEFGSRHVINTDPDSKPDKLVFSHTADYRELIVPFEFKDIPLP